MPQRARSDWVITHGTGKHETRLGAHVRNESDANRALRKIRMNIDPHAELVHRPNPRQGEDDFEHTQPEEEDEED